MVTQEKGKYPEKKLPYARPLQKAPLTPFTERGRKEWSGSLHCLFWQPKVLVHPLNTLLYPKRHSYMYLELTKT